jgi:hypothetical protein
MTKVYLCGQYLWSEKTLKRVLPEYFGEAEIVQDSSTADILIAKAHPLSIKDMLESHRKNQIRVFWATEAVFPDLNLFDYAVGFDVAQVSDRYIRAHPVITMARHVDLRSGLSQKKNLLASEHRMFCDYIYSNPKPHKMRDSLVDIFSNYRHVNSFGLHRNNAGETYFATTSQANWLENKLEVHSQHKFSLAIENANHRGYTTEKLVTPTLVGSIPIYWGNPDVGLDFNEKSFVNLHSFESIQDGLEFVIELDNDEKRYLEMQSQPILSADQHKLVESNELELKKFFSRILQQDFDCGLRRGDGTYQTSYEERQVNLYRSTFPS